jgi:AI-2 transport protein TqsA
MVTPVARVLLIGAAAVVIISGLRAAQSLLVPFIVAVFLSVLSTPLLRMLRRKGVPTGVGVALIVLIVLAAIAVIGTLVGSTAGELTEALPMYRQRFDELIGTLIAFLGRNGFAVKRTAIEGVLDPSNVLAAIVVNLQGLLGALSNVVLILLTMIFILLEAATFPTKLEHAVGDPKLYLTRFATVAKEVQRYLAYKTALNAITAVILGVWCMVLDVDFPVLWGLTTFLLNYIPNIGSFIATLPPVFLALIENGPGRAIVALIGYVTVNTLLGNVLEPMVLGRRLGLSPLVVFLSLILWGWIWGPVGMLLSVPLTMVVKISLENSDRYGFVANLLDSKPRARSAK